MNTDAWLRLARAPAVHGQRLDALLRHFGSIDAVTAAPRRALLAAGLDAASAARITAADDAGLVRARRWLAAPGHFLLPWTDADYPPLLREIADPPAVLFGRGDVTALSWPQLAIVGSRKATPGGRDTARRLAAALGRAGLGITSGLAQGIDAAAHAGALQAATPTVAVCGTGPDRVYPHRHAALAEEIAAAGALVSEYLPGTPAQAFQFPRRNRIISGLAVGTVVVEAGVRSGALITARLAGEQGREVFAVPGSIHNPVARGCHRLIRQGARLVETAADIGEELGAQLAWLRAAIEQNEAAGHAAASPAPDAAHTRLLSCMGWDPVSADELADRAGLTAAEVSSMLLILELAGRVEPLAGGRYQQREEGRSS